MTIYCTRGQHHRCETCDCGCHPDEENVSVDAGIAFGHFSGFVIQGNTFDEEE